ncbi:MAG: amidohydrolase family protein [Pseudomonadota bacterium]
MFFTCNAMDHDNCSHSRQVSERMQRYNATEVTSAAKGLATGAAARESRPGLRIDIHCHYLNTAVGAKAAVLKPFEKEPSIVHASQATRDVNMGQMKLRAAKLSDIPTRLADMDRMGIDVQAVSPAPTQYYYYAEPDFGLELARGVNDGIANVVAAQPERFVGIGSVPLQDATMAVRELTRCVEKLGFRGIEIGTHVNGVDLADKRLGLDKFFAKAEALGTMLFLHPMGFTQGERMTEHYFNNFIGNPVESTLAVSHLIFGGVMERFPKLKVCVPHGGGYMTMAHARMDHGWKVRPDAQAFIKKKPSSYLKKFYFDTVTFNPRLISDLVEQFGASHVMMGSDYPFDMGDEDPVGLVQRAPGLTSEVQAQILGGNAMKLLGIKRSARRPVTPKAA